MMKKISTYTKMSNANEILKTKTLRLGMLNTMNDPNEGFLYTGALDHAFSICFTRNKEESIPMWYLYGGVDGRGVIISFSYSGIQSLVKRIENGELELIGSNNKKFKTNDFSIIHGSVNYVDYSYSAKRDDISSLLYKGKEWAYEDEYRIVIVVKETGKRLTFLKIRFDEINTSVLLGPECANDYKSFLIRNNYKDLLSKIELQQLSNRKSFSNLKIRMNLLDRNEDLLFMAIQRKPKLIIDFFKMRGISFPELINNSSENNDYQQMVEYLINKLNE